MSAGTGSPAASRNVGAKSTLSAIASLRVPGLDAGRPADEERHPQRLLVHEPLVEQAVVAEEEALVAGVDDDRVLREAGCVEVVEHAADAVVDRLHRRQVVLHVALVLPAHQRLAGQRDRLAVARRSSPCRASSPATSSSAAPARPAGGVELEIAPRQVGGDALLVLVQRVGARRVGVPERGRLGNPAVRELRRVRRRPAPTAGAAPCGAASGRTACRAAGSRGSRAPGR